MDENNTGTADLERLKILEAALRLWMLAQRKGAPRSELLAAEARLREVASGSN
jgi:hypothetical protein